jgi:hypothetical protein
MLASSIIDSNRCIICSYRKKTSDELMQYPYPLCQWCAGPNLYGMLVSLNDEIKAQVEAEPMLDCINNDLFSFLSDLGELAASHPHLQVARDIIGVLLMNVLGQNRIDYLTLANQLPRSLRSRVVTTLFYLRDMHLIDLTTEESDEGIAIITEITITSDGLFQKAFRTIQASATWETHREPNLILSYILIEGIVQTLDIIQSQGNLEMGQGVTRLFVNKGKILVPKQFTAPLVFILGAWASQRDEFSEDTLIGFLGLRGFNKKERNRIMQFIAGISVGCSHTLYRTERTPTGHGIQSIRFLLNPKYQNIRDRIRSRARPSRA